jgi:hypothetical protein
VTTLTVIREPDDLAHLRSSALFPGRSLQLRLSELDGHEARSWESRLNRHYRACGCGTSAAFLGVALCVGVALLAMRPGGVLAVGVLDLGLLAVAVIGAGVVGKLVGLAVARVRLHVAIRALRRRLRA